MGRPVKDSRHHTYAEYLTWPVGLRYELIDGEAYLMAPAPTADHQRLVLAVARQIADVLEGSRCEVFVAPFDVRLPKGNEADDTIETVVQPDLTIVCDPEKIDQKGCRGAPDWIIEVLSPTTAVYDQTVKLRAYEQAGVPECWFVHPTDRTVAVYRLTGDHYERPDISGLVGTLRCQSVTTVNIDWERILR